MIIILNEQLLQEIYEKGDNHECFVISKELLHSSVEMLGNGNKIIKILDDLESLYFALAKDSCSNKDKQEFVSMLAEIDECREYIENLM